MMASISLMLLLCTTMSMHMVMTTSDVPAAQPLRMPPYQKVYEFEMEVSKTITMTSYDDGGNGHLVDYDVDSQQWYQRDSDHLSPCNRTEKVDPTTLERFLQGDGLHRRMITVNGKSPGDTIIVPYGAEVVLRVHNGLMSEGISIHVHGMDQVNRWYMDGVAPVQQCPISAGSTFTYRFIADFAGTLWYHGHHAADRGDGLLGGFVVMDTDQTVTLMEGKKSIPDKQYSLVLQDIHRLSQSENHLNLEDNVMKFSYGFENMDKCWRWSKTYDLTNIGGSSPVQSIWFNQRGWHNQQDVQNRPWALPLERFMVDGDDESVMFRVVHAGFAFELMVSVEQHQFTIVAADGAKIKPVKADYLVLFPGERYDIVIETKKTPEHRRYYILAETMEAWDESFASRAHQYGLAVLEYNVHIPDEQRLPDFNKMHCTAESKCMVVNCPFKMFPPGVNLDCINSGELKSLEEPTDKGVMGTEFPPNGFQEFYINMHFDSNVNGFTFSNPQAPPYFYGSDTEATPGAEVCDPVKCHPLSGPDSDACKCFFHLKVRQDVVVQLVLYNMGDGSTVHHGYAHPFHLHGQHFYLMKAGHGVQNPKNGWLVSSNTDIDCTNPANPGCVDARWTDKNWIGGNITGMNQIDPSYRDTVVLPPGGYIVLRFRASNPGWFFAHCHLVLHSWGGMAMALQVGEHSQMPKPPAGFPAGCGRFEPPPINP